MARAAALIVALVLVVPPAPAGAAERRKVAVLGFVSDASLPQHAADALTDLAANTARAIGDYDVIGKSDLDSLIGFERIKDRLGCNDTSCLAEIGGALGVDLILAGNIARLGDTLLVNLRLIDPVRTTVVAGVSKKVSGGDAELIDAVPLATNELFAGGGAPAARSEAPATAAASTAGGGSWVLHAAAGGAGVWSEKFDKVLGFAGAVGFGWRHRMSPLLSVQLRGDVPFVVGSGMVVYPQLQATLRVTPWSESVPVYGGLGVHAGAGYGEGSYEVGIGSYAQTQAYFIGGGGVGELGILFGRSDLTARALMGWTSMGAIDEPAVVVQLCYGVRLFGTD